MSDYLYRGKKTYRDRTPTSMYKDDIKVRPVGRGGSRGSLEPPFWPPKDFIYTASTF